MKVRIKIGALTLRAEIDENNETGKKILSILPIKAKAITWGEEIYFPIDLYLPEAPDAVQDVEVGDLCYWPPGHAFCIFFGPTPVSISDKPRAYSPVMVFGKLLDDPKQLKKVKDGEEIIIEKL